MTMASRALAQDGGRADVGGGETVDAVHQRHPLGSRSSARRRPPLLPDPARVRLLRCVRRPFINVTGLTSLVPVYHAFDTRRRVPCIPTHRGMVSCRRKNAVLSRWSRRVHADPQLQVCQCSPCDVAEKPVQVQMLIPLVSSTLALCTKQALDDELRDAEQIPAC